MNLLAPLYALADRLRRRHADLGEQGEDLAHRWLRRHGYTVAARNWRPPQGGGEIDLVAWQGGSVVFVEVKTRSQDSLSAPERSLDAEKIRALRRSARDYLRRSGADSTAARFDAIAIEGSQLEHLPDIFPL